MTDKSRAPDWRRAEDYEYIDALEPDQRRWEFLRRSREYRAAYAQGRLSNPTIARMRFGIVGAVPDPDIRGDELPESFGFASEGALTRRSTARPLKPLPALGPTFVDFRIDLTKSIAAQVAAVEIEAKRLAEELSAKWSAQEAASKARRLACGPFASLATQVTTSSDDPASIEDGPPALDSEKHQERRAPTRLLRVLDAIAARQSEIAEALLNGRAGLKREACLDTDDAARAAAVRREAANARQEIANALFKGHAGNLSTDIQKARLAASAAAKMWP
jgi:hypothetical protein